MKNNICTYGTLSSVPKIVHLPTPATEMAKLPIIPMEGLGKEDISTASLITRDITMVPDTDSSSVIGCLCRATIDCFKYFTPLHPIQIRNWRALGH